MRTTTFSGPRVGVGVGVRVGVDVGVAVSVAVGMGVGVKVGVGVGLRSRAGTLTDEVAIIVMVSKKHLRADLSSEDLLPDEIEGVPVDVQEVGEIAPHA